MNLLELSDVFFDEIDCYLAMDISYKPNPQPFCDPEPSSNQLTENLPNQPNPMKKTKPIHKTRPKQSSSHSPLLHEPPSHPKKMGRPNNHQAEARHMQESRSLNDVIFHYNYLLALFALKKGLQDQMCALDLSAQEKLWVDSTEQIMSFEIYPEFSAAKPLFLLHQNSLHFVFQHYYLKERKENYSAEQLKFMFLAFLKHRRLLTAANFIYVLEYWQDIICLATGEEDTEEDGWEEQEMGDKKRLRHDLVVDDSRIAYEIACYLNACSKKYSFSIAGTGDMS